MIKSLTAECQNLLVAEKTSGVQNELRECLKAVQDLKVVRSYLLQISKELADALTRIEKAKDFET